MVLGAHNFTTSRVELPRFVYGGPFTNVMLTSWTAGSECKLMRNFESRNRKYEKNLKHFSLAPLVKRRINFKESEKDEGRKWFNPVKKLVKNYRVKIEISLFC